MNVFCKLSVQVLQEANSYAFIQTNTRLSVGLKSAKDDGEQANHR